MEGLTRSTSIVVEECAKKLPTSELSSSHVPDQMPREAWTFTDAATQQKIARHVKKQTRRLFITECKTFLDARCGRVRFLTWPVMCADQFTKKTDGHAFGSSIVPSEVGPAPQMSSVQVLQKLSHAFLGCLAPKQ